MKRCWIVVGVGAALFAPEALAQTYSRTEVISYHDNLGEWVVGQIAKVTCVAPTECKPAYAPDGIVISQVDYDARALQQRVYSFGKLQYSLGYNADGTLATVSDGRSFTTTLSGWKRGIPQTISYPATPEVPAGASKSAVVNEDGTIASTTDENGYVTSYSYDAIGRLAGITYPTADSTNWNSTTFSFVPVATEEMGIPAGHWRQKVTQGNYEKTTYFDALWQPLVVTEQDLGNPSQSFRISVNAFDTSGQQTLASYPRNPYQEGQWGPWTGRHMSYDALGRLTQVQQDSELGVLTTTTEYLSGFKTRVTNPRGFATTTSYLVYDQPATDWPTSIVHPEGAYTDIARDAFGKPTSLVRRNADSSMAVTRSYAYDVNQRLCRATEPETGVTLTGYDDAGNLAWSAAGLPAETACDLQGNTAAILARKASRTYDARNRLTSLTFPDGRGNQLWSYTPDGLPAQVTTYNEIASGGAVVNSYAYNKRRLLTGESVTQPDQYSWALGYEYNANAHLISHQYPDGLTLTYSPNALGQTTAVQDTSGKAYATGVSYYPNGGMQQFTYGNGIVHTLTQNLRGLPDTSRDAYNTTAFLSDGYDYDHNGNVAAITDGAIGTGQRGNRTMTYDGLDRLKTTASPMYSASPSSTASYTYDVLDNLTRVVAPGRDHYYCYDINWRLTNIKTGSCGGTSVIGLGYDVQGNLDNKNGQGFQFDHGNRLRVATSKESYRYDSHGRRVQALRAGQDDTYSFYSQDGVLRYQEDYKQAKASRYIYLNGSQVARVTSATTTLLAPALGAPATSSNGAYTVSWPAVAGASRYRLEESANNGAWSEVANTSALSWNASGKASGSYRYRARSCQMSCSAYSVIVTVTVESAPAGIPTITAPDYDTDGTYTVQWTSVSLATRYELEEQSNGGAWALIHNAAATSKAISGKTTGSYGYRVRACNTVGCAAWSATKTVAIELPPASPPPLTVPAQGLSGSYTVTWSTAAGATSYKLDETSNGGSTWTEVYAGTAQSKAFSGKAAGSHGYRIKACNPAGCSGVSPTGTVSVIYPPGAAPTLSAPAQAANGNYTVSWTTVAGATRYELDESPLGGAWTKIQDSTTTSKAFAGKSAGGYAYQVRACNEAGCGPTSSPSNVQVVYPPSSAPTVTAPAQSSNGSYTVSWTAVPGATDYRLEESANSGAWAEVQNAAATSRVFSGKGNGSYGYRARACNIAGCGGYSNTATVSVVLPPPTPQILSAHKHVTIQGPIVTQTCSVQWSSAAGAASYQLRVYQGSIIYTGSQTYVSSGPYSTEYCAPSFEVQACNGSGCSAWSSPPFQQTYSEEVIPEGDPQ